MENKIGVYAICKNEAKFVDRWVASMKEADYIVVYDTGSTDDTIEKFQPYVKEGIVKLYTDLLGPDEPFEFDKARNLVLEKLPDDCNIRAAIDLDEVFDEGWADKFRSNWVESIHTIANYSFVWSHLENGAPGRIFTANKVHGKDWIWKYPVHEQLWNTKRESGTYFATETLHLPDLYLHHYPDSQKSRGSYLPLLELRVAKYPDDVSGKIYLAHEYFYRGRDDDSIAMIKEIFEKHEIELSSLLKANLYTFSADAYTRKKEYETAEMYYKKAIHTDKTYRDAYLNLADLYNMTKQFGFAISTLDDAVRDSRRHYSWLERDTTWSYRIWDLYSIAKFYHNKHNDRLDSLAYAYKAYCLNKNNERLKKNLELIENQITEDSLK